MSTSLHLVFPPWRMLQKTFPIIYKEPLTPNISPLVLVFVWKCFKHLLSLHSFLPHCSISFLIRKGGKKQLRKMRLKIFLVQELANPMVCEFTTAYKLGDLHADYIWCHLIFWQEWDSQHLFSSQKSLCLSSAAGLAVLVSLSAVWIHPLHSDKVATSIITISCPYTWGWLN